MRKVLFLILGSILQAAAQTSAGQLDELLQKAGASAEAFAAAFPAMTCMERVVQTKLGEGMKVLARREEHFDYLILLEADGDELIFEESRLARDGTRKAPQQPLLTTTGFAVLALVLHPRYQASYRFTLLEPEQVGGKLWERVAFEHLGGHASPSVLEVSGRQYPLAWRGVAWLDRESGHLWRIRAELKDPLEDIGLVSLKAGVDYSPGGGETGIWFPRTAQIEARTRHQIWSNTHEFSAYRRFDVTTEQRVQEVVK